MAATAIAGLATFSGGQTSQPNAASSRSFEVASVRQAGLTTANASEDRSRANIVVLPDNLVIRDRNLRDCIQWAYGVKNYQILGPEWLNTEKYEISAKAESPVPEAEMRLMLQRLLAERFHLLLHREQKLSPVYALIVKRNGPKMRESNADSSSVKLASPGLRLVFQRVAMSQLADTLSTLAFIDRPVIDMTKLNSFYDFTLDLREVARSGDPPPPGSAGQAEGGALPGASGVSIFTVLGEQLGLGLNPARALVDVLVVDHAERMPTAN